MSRDRGDKNLTGVGATAIGLARLRAAESHRSDRLFDDPFAKEFVAASGASPMTSDREPAGVWASIASSIPVRTRFIDDFVLDACGAGLRQFVLVGAGLDMRAYRLPWPAGVRIFELDLGDVFSFKESVITQHGWIPTPERIVVPCDLRGEWQRQLVSETFDEAQPTAWVLEGLLIYLSDEENDHLIDQIGAHSAPSSRMALAHHSRAGLEKLRGALHNYRDQTASDIQAMWRSGLAEDPMAWLARHGWRATVFDPAERAVHYDRPPAAAGESRFPTASTWFITAERDPEAGNW